MSGGVDFYIQAIVSVLVITDPITRGILFKAMTAGEPERRPEFVRKIALTVGITLGVAAIAGKQILDALGIDLGAFGIAGGLVVSLMGFEMLFGGEPSRAQGGEEAHEEPRSFEGNVIIPYAIPFVAGPGAIALVITIASSTSGWEGPIAAVAAVAAAVALLPVGHLYLAEKINLSESGMKIFTKFGGLLIATIGIQLMLNGIVKFFGLE